MEPSVSKDSKYFTYLPPGTFFRIRSLIFSHFCWCCFTISCYV